ncbi:hypothetical protein MM5_217 [Morganella phage vB_Mm5]
MFFLKEICIGFCNFLILLCISLKKKVMAYYKKCVDEATDREWSTARTPDPNAFQYQDNFFVQWMNKRG